MPQNILIYPVLGLVIALSGFGYYAMAVFRAYKEEKRRIEEDFGLSKKYEPKRGEPMTMIFIMLGSPGVVYVLITSVLLMVSATYDALPNASGLVARFIMLLGATVFVGDLSRIPYSVKAARELSYQPPMPDYIREEKDMQKRNEMLKEYGEKNGLKNPRENFGKYIVFVALPETMLIYMYLITIMLMIFGGLMEKDATGIEDIDPGLASAMFATGILYIVLMIPAIFSMKKSAEMEMTPENFPKKVLVALYGFIPSIIGLVIMIYTMLPLIS